MVCEVSKWWKPSGSEIEELFNRIRRNIEEFLDKTTEGVEVYNFNRCYYEATKEEIPVARLGFSSLGELLFHCDDIIQVRAKHCGRLHLYLKKSVEDVEVSGQTDEEADGGRVPVDSAVLLNVFSTIPEAPVKTATVLSTNMNSVNVTKRPHKEAPTMQYYVPPRSRNQSQINGEKDVRPSFRYKPQVNGENYLPSKIPNQPHANGGYHEPLRFRNQFHANGKYEVAPRFRNKSRVNGGGMTLPERNYTTEFSVRQSVKPQQVPRNGETQKTDLLTRLVGASNRQGIRVLDPILRDGWTLTWEQAASSDFVCLNEQPMMLCGRSPRSSVKCCVETAVPSAEQRVGSRVPFSSSSDANANQQKENVKTTVDAPVGIGTRMTFTALSPASTSESADHSAEQTIATRASTPPSGNSKMSTSLECPERKSIFRIPTQHLSPYPRRRSAVILGADVYGHIFIRLKTSDAPMEQSLNELFPADSVATAPSLSTEEVFLNMVAVVKTKTGIRRVRVESIREDQHCFVRDIDAYDALLVRISELYHPPAAFLNSPAKAIKCVLKGLEEFMYTAKIRDTFNAAKLHGLEVQIDVCKSWHPFFLVPWISAATSTSGEDLAEIIRRAGILGSKPYSSDVVQFQPSLQQKKIRNFLKKSGNLNFGLWNFNLKGKSQY